MQPGPIAPGELDEFIVAVGTAFHDAPHDEDRLECLRRLHERGRELVVRDDGRIVATSTVASLELTVPGAIVPAAGVTAVGVRPTHRRRGLAAALMRAQLHAVRDAGREAVAFLWASEAAIYGRFGYGRATEMGQLKVRSDRTALRPELRPEGARAELTLDPAAALDDLRAVHDAARPRRPGMIARSSERWQRALSDRPEDRDGARPLRAVIVRDPGGAPEAYALYAVKGHVGFEEAEVVLRELVAATARGHRAAWAHVLELDLTSRVAYLLAPADDEILWALTDSRAAQHEPTDGVWVRLVDVDRALAARRYARELDVVLEVADEECRWNAGRHRLSAAADGRATCVPTEDPADLRLEVEALGSAYLGGPSLRALGDAGRVEERRDGALDAAAAAFRGTREPWCPDIF